MPRLVRLRHLLEFMPNSDFKDPNSAMMKRFRRLTPLEKQRIVKRWRDLGLELQEFAEDVSAFGGYLLIVSI